LVFPRVFVTMATSILSTVSLATGHPQDELVGDGDTKSQFG